MSASATLLKPNGTAADDATEGHGLTQLHLHWLGVALLLGVNLFLAARLAMLWHAAGAHNADAIARQRLALKTADAAAEPLRGVDAKVAKSTADADLFYRERLPSMQSQIVAELGDVARRNNVRLVGVHYDQAQVLTGTPDELTEEKMDASLSGDYRPLVQFINALERDKTFFAIDGLTLTGQQSGLVGLRLRLTTYVRGAEAVPASEIAGSGAGGAIAGGTQ